MAMTTIDLVRQIVEETNYSEKIVTEILHSFQKQILWDLVEAKDHKVLMQNFMTFELKDGYKPGMMRLGKPVSCFTKKLNVALTSNLKRKISKQGIEKTIVEIWGR